MIDYISLIGAFFCGWVAGVITIIFILEFSFAPKHEDFDDDDDDDDDSAVKPIH
jgi:hypothetical protein